MALQFDGVTVGAMQYNGVTIGEAMIDGVVVYRSVIRVTPTPPTFHDGEPWITLPTVEGVTYSVSGTPGYDASVTVTATAQAGYELVGTASWSHTFGPEPLPVVAITGTGGSESRDQFRQACTQYGVNYQTVQELPFRLDTSQATSLINLFNGCSSLTQVPDMDTSQVTSMSSMCRGCSSLTQVPDMDTSQVTSMSSMFYNCGALTQVPDMDTSQVTNVHSMFYNCGALTDGNVRLIGRHPNVINTNMILGSGLTREPFYDQQGNPI